MKYSLWPRPYWCDESYLLYSGLFSFAMDLFKSKFHCITKFFEQYLGVSRSSLQPSWRPCQEGLPGCLSKISKYSLLMFSYCFIRDLHRCQKFIWLYYCLSLLFGPSSCCYLLEFTLLEPLPGHFSFGSFTMINFYLGYSNENIPLWAQKPEGQKIIWPSPKLGPKDQNIVQATAWERDLNMLLYKPCLHSLI